MFDTLGFGADDWFESRKSTPYTVATPHYRQRRQNLPTLAQLPPTPRPLPPTPRPHPPTHRPAYTGVAEPDVLLEDVVAAIWWSPDATHTGVCRARTHSHTYTYLQYLLKILQYKYHYQLVYRFRPGFQGDAHNISGPKFNNE